VRARNAEGRDPPYYSGKYCIGEIPPGEVRERPGEKIERIRRVGTREKTRTVDCGRRGPSSFGGPRCRPCKLRLYGRYRVIRGQSTIIIRTITREEIDRRRRVRFLHFVRDEVYTNRTKLLAPAFSISSEESAAHPPTINYAARNRRVCQ